MRSITYPILHKMHMELGDYRGYFNTIPKKGIRLSTANPGNTDWFSNGGWMPECRPWHFSPNPVIICFRPYRFVSYPDYKLSVRNKTTRYLRSLGDGETRWEIRVLSLKTIHLAEYVASRRVTIGVGLQGDWGLANWFHQKAYGESYRFGTMFPMILDLKDVWLHEWYINPTPSTVYSGVIGRYTNEICKKLREYKAIIDPMFYKGIVSHWAVTHPSQYGL